MIYILFFILSATCVHIGSKRQKHGRWWYFLGALLLSVLAGARNYSVGTDISVYGLNVFRALQNNPNLFSLYSSGALHIEPGFALIALISTKLFHDAHGMLFLVAFINYALIALAVDDYKEEISPSLSWLCFCFIYFSDTLNIMRQCLALAIIFFGFRFVRRKEIKKYLICVLIATLFHTSAVIGITIYLIYYFVLNYTGKKLFGRITFCLGISIVFTVGFNYIFSALINFGVLSTEYTRYLTGQNNGIPINSIILRLIPLALIALYWKNYKRNKDSIFALLMMIFDILFYNLTAISETFYRVGLYMGYFRLFGYSYLNNSISLSKTSNKRLIYLFYLIYLLFMFYYQVIMKNANGIYPYSSFLF